MQRLGLSLMAVLMLSACSSVSDRYAFWRDTNPPTNAGAKPNLADVPAAPNTQDAKTEMDAMRQRLETDRNNSYMAAQGMAVPDVTPISDTTNPNTAPLPVEPSAAGNEMAPAMGSTSTAPYNAAPVIPYQQQTAVVGNVQYNYGSNDNYVYGNSNVQYGGAQYAQQNVSSPYQQQAAQEMANNPSVSINFDALGGGNAPDNSISSVGLTGQPVVYFKHGSARLGSGDRRKIKELAQQLKSTPSSVVVVGHASKRTGIKSAVASKSANLTISAKRATVVMQELAKAGVKPQQLNVTAAGDTTAGSASEAQDRRVDLLFDR